MEHETMKLKEQDEDYSKELKEWKAQLKPRKQVLGGCWFRLSFYSVDFLVVVGQWWHV